MSENWETVNQKPFWKPETEGDHIEGVTGNLRELQGDYGPSTVVDVGDHSVNVSAGLRALVTLEGQYVRLTYQGFEKSKKGRDFKKFLVQVRKTP